MKREPPVATLRRITQLTRLEAETRRQVDDLVRYACEDLDLPLAAVGRAAGVTATAIRLRRKRGWRRAGRGGFKSRYGKEASA